MVCRRLGIDFEFRFVQLVRRRLTMTLGAPEARGLARPSWHMLPRSFDRTLTILEQHGNIMVADLMATLIDLDVRADDFRTIARFHTDGYVRLPLHRGSTL